jgi:hypothetical protein
MKSRLEFAFTTEQSVDAVARAIVDGTADGVPFERALPPLPGARISPPAQLTLFNGSPRGAKGNTPIMLEKVGQGFSAAGGTIAETLHLVRQNSLADYRDAFAAPKPRWWVSRSTRTRCRASSRRSSRRWRRCAGGAAIRRWAS